MNFSDEDKKIIKMVIIGVVAFIIFVAGSLYAYSFLKKTTMVCSNSEMVEDAQLQYKNKYTIIYNVKSDKIFKMIHQMRLSSDNSENVYGGMTIEEIEKMLQDEEITGVTFEVVDSDAKSITMEMVIDFEKVNINEFEKNNYLYAWTNMNEADNKNNFIKNKVAVYSLFKEKVMDFGGYSCHQE